MRFATVNLKTSFRRVAREEEGLLSIFSLTVMVGVMIGLCLVVNAIHIVRTKLEAQNAADAVAQAAGTHMARGMNAITAANHVIGEMQGLVVLHHALGGDPLDGGGGGNHAPGDVQQAVPDTHSLAQAWTVGVPQALRPQPPHFAAASQPVLAAAAIGDSRVHLKKVISYAYVAHAVGGFFYTYAGLLPYVGPAMRAVGVIVMTAALTFETKVFVEWRLLDAIEAVARSLSPLKQNLRDVMIPGFYAYTRSQQELTPIRMEDAAVEIGKFHVAQGSLFPGLRINPSSPRLRLPVTPEPSEFASGQVWRSQLVRASAPWVQYWRVPILQLGERALRLARFKSYYVKHTQAMTLSLATAAKQRGINLLILDGLDIARMNKGDEPWSRASGSRQADKLFGVVAFGYRDAPPLAAPGFFGEVNADGIAAFAQTMIYNANPQTGGQGTAQSGGGESFGSQGFQRSNQAVGQVILVPGTTRFFSNSQLQPEVGFDTLNWLGSQTPEWSQGNDPNPLLNTPASYFASRAPEPRIRIHWQTLLVPATRIGDAPQWQQGNLGKLMKRTAADIPAARTH